MKQFERTLLPFQAQGVAWLTGKNALLGDQAGVGKTPQAIFLTKDKPKVLVLTMASLKFQFQNELKKFLPQAQSVVINGTPLQRKAQWLNANVQYYIANYELLLKDLKFMHVYDWDYIVADECTRLSNHSNKQWKALQQLRSQHRLAMTGTAISNSPLDCYGIFEWLNPSSLGNYWAFVAKYCVQKQLPNGGRFTVGFRNLEELSKRIEPFYIRRTKEQVLPELPEKREIELPFELNQNERRIYDTIKTRMLMALQDADVSKIEHLSQLENGIVNLMRLRQLVCSPQLLGEHTDSSKFQVLKDLLLTIPDRKVIIFSEFAEMCKIINTVIPSVMIIGEVKTENRARIVEQFNTDPNTRILVMSAAGAFGLNLQAADVVIHYDLPWSVAKYEQRASRSHRMGQKNTVFEYSLIAKGSVDEFVQKKLNKKQDLSEQLLPISELMELLI